jgi:tetratricopeptide (TPR) repeat protein
MRLVLTLSVLLGGFAAHAAPPNPDRARARALYESATTHYNLSEFGDALKDFKEAYRVIKDPILLFNIAQCHRQLKEYEEAAKLFRAYRREHPQAPNRDEVDRLIHQMDEAIAEQRNRQPPPNSATVSLRRGR